jgi:Fe-S-cluster containining protein
LKHTIDIKLTAVTSEEPEEKVPCGYCTLCCQVFAPFLTPDEVSSGKYPLSLVNGEYGPMVTLFRKPEGGCGMFVDGKCSIYEDRPKACRQFDCRKGHGLPKVPNQLGDK